MAEAQHFELEAQQHDGEAQKLEDLLVQTHFLIPFSFQSFYLEDVPNIFAKLR